MVTISGRGSPREIKIKREKLITVTNFRYFGCCCCCYVVVLRLRKISKVMSGRSVDLTTLFLGRLRPPKLLTSTSCT